MSLTPKIGHVDDSCPICINTDSGTTKNKRTMTGKLEMKKFDPKVRKHVMYKEAKIK